MLPLLIWITGPSAEPRAVTVPELLIETTPLTLLRTPVPVWRVNAGAGRDGYRAFVGDRNVAAALRSGIHTIYIRSYRADELSRVAVTLPVPQL